MLAFNHGKVKCFFNFGTITYDTSDFYSYLVYLTFCVYFSTTY